MLGEMTVVLTWMMMPGPYPPRALRARVDVLLGLAEDARAQVLVDVVALLQVVLLHAQRHRQDAPRGRAADEGPAENAQNIKCWNLTQGLKV